MTSIPASRLVQVIPGVLGAGGNPLALNALILTQNPSVPIGVVMSFSTLEDVQNFFGSTSTEAGLATIYFAGFENSSTLPGTLYFSQFNTADVPAYLRGGSQAGVTIAELQLLSGVVQILIDGKLVTSSSINLSGATSFSSAANLVQTGLQVQGGIFEGTAAQTPASTTMTVSAVVAGTLHVGDVITGTGVTAGTTIVSQDSGTPGGAGDYTVDNDDGFLSTSIYVSSDATVSYDSQLLAFVITSGISGADSSVDYAQVSGIVTGLKLTAATNAVKSPGADTATPAGALADIVAATQNWATFMTAWQPLLADKLLFADWVTTSNDRYAYVCWDTDADALTANASGTFGALTANFDGVIPVWENTGKATPGEMAAFICGYVASLDFTTPNGRTTLAFRKQSGLTADVTNATIADNLIGNGYNFYGSYATANDEFTFMQNGQISGDWEWVDEYVNQIYLNNQLQLALLSLLASMPSIPYNTAGYSLIRAAAMDPVNEALAFGTIRIGVPLSSSQAAQVNTAAGVRISDTLTQVGWYLQITPASAQTRALRESPPMTLWYMSGGSIQKIELSSIDIL